MNLLIFPQYAFPANHAVVNTVFEGLLPDRGHTVHMIRPMAGVAETRVLASPWAGGSMVVYPHAKTAGVAANGVGFFRRSRWLREAVDKIEALPIDAVLLRNDLQSAAAGLRFARRRGIPFVYQLSSPDAEFRIEEGRRRGGPMGIYQRVRGRLDLGARRRVMRSASAVLAVSDAMGEYLVALDGLDKRRVFSFPMGVRESVPPPPEASEALRRERSLRRDRTIVYSGVIDPVRDSAFMLDVLEKVREEIPDATLLVLTYQGPDDARRLAFEAEATRRFPSDGRGAAVKVVGPLTHREVWAHLHCADVMMSPYPPMLEHNICSPTKSIEGMCAALPVVGSVEVVEHATMFAACDGGIAVVWDRDAFADAIVSLIRDPERRRSMGERGRRWVLENRTYARLTDYLERILANAGSVARLGELPHRVEDGGRA